MVRVSRSGGISLDSSMVLAVGNISGDQDKEFRTELRKALKANSDVKMLPDAYGAEALTDTTYRSIAATLSQRGQKLVLITGRYTLDEHDEHKERDGPDNTKVGYIERTFTGRFAFGLSDPPENTLAFARELQAYASEEKDASWIVNAIVDAIITDPTAGKVRRMIIDDFIYELYPHAEFYDAKFYKDSDMPELASGIAYANLGRWDEAIASFKSVPGKYPANENIHKAYYNLGIAYKWMTMFAEARENLEKAYLLKQSSEYYDEIQDLARFEEEYYIRQKETPEPGN